MADVEIKSLGGQCPVQGYGTINGKAFYFRARGEEWSMSIGGDDVILSPEWYHEEEYGDAEWAAGYMSEDEARGFISKAASMFAASPSLPSES